MRIFGFGHKKLNRNVDERPDKLTPEEEADLEGRVPDQETVTVASATEVTTPEGTEVVETETEEPAPGILRTQDLVKKYGKRTVANKVSIEVKQGEIVGLLGPNGAGKTTTFYMTVGLISPNSGRVYLDGHDITEYPVYKRAKMGIGYLPQEASVFRTLSVENNIRAILEMSGTSKEYQKEKLEQLIREFKLEHVRRNKGSNLSGGERRRTEIARCLEDIQSVVYHLKERNIGVLITDHKADSILGITDRAYMLFEGKVLFQGTSEELVANPIVREKYLGRDFVFIRKKFE